MITREMIENRFKTGKKGYRKDLSVKKGKNYGKRKWY